MEEIKKVNESIKALSFDERQAVSDGYHTYADLYSHRNNLFIALCRSLHDSQPHIIFKTRRDWDNNEIESGWFIAGIFNTRTGVKISYHLPDYYWNLLMGV